MNEPKQSQPLPSTDSAEPKRYDNIFDAIEFNNLSEFKRLMEIKAELDKPRKGDLNTSALEYAASMGRETMVDMILKRRKIPYELNYALCNATFLGNSRIVESLLKARAPLSANFNVIYRGPLHTAAYRGHLSIVELLIKAKANVMEKQDYGGQYPLELASFFGHADVVNALLAAKGGLDIETVKGRAQIEGALFIAADKGHAPVVKTLLEAKASLRSAEKLLKNIAEKGHISVLQELLAAGLDIDLPVNRGFDGTILHVSLNEKWNFFACALIKARASFDAVNYYEMTPLHIAAKLGNTQIIQMLLMGITDLEARDHLKRTPLLHAVDSCCDEAVQLLIRAKARIDFSHPESGDNILHYAIREFSAYHEVYRTEAKRIQTDQTNIIKTLFRAKASSLLHTRNFNNETPLQLALTMNVDHIASLLLNECNKQREIALLATTHQASGRHSFWNKAKQPAVKDRQVFRLIFTAAFGTPSTSNSSKPAIEPIAEKNPCISPGQLVQYI